ncbi:response regulator [Pseudorhodoferax sp. Leaf267]|uniref:response regulator n=1 Tax=Pseudorhodoferax sp. Leaf267 TaxID=1736316 RepID=UPI0006F53AEA|nr:response regulator [Pseudorhodoferax sp. Leaf267]KQP17605.1 hypothetical protein ASF43_06830 [Pseudorhodoferax sp. Leaf267]
MGRADPAPGAGVDRPAQRLPRAAGRWAAALGCLLLGLVVAALHHRHVLQGLQAGLQRDAQVLAEQVENLSTDGKVMGSAILMGLVDQEIKKLLAGERAPDDAALNAAFQAVIGEYQADNVLVLDAKGRTQAYVSRDPGVRGLGRDLSVRPYFQRAIAGEANLYPAVGKNSGERGIYLAAPVRARPDPQAAVVGVVVVKIGLERLDTMLARYPHAALLVSPDGVVFGGNRRPWLLQLAEPMGPGAQDALVRSEQFGDLFTQGTPQQLPLQWTGDGAQGMGTQFTLAEEPLNWPGTGKGWRLLLLRERTLADAWLASAALGLATFALAMAFGTYALRRQSRRLRRALQRRADVARLRGMLEAMPQGVAVLDVDGAILYANSALERLAGAPAQGLVGMRLPQLLALDATPEQLLADCHAAPDQLVETRLQPMAGPPVPVGLAVASFDEGGERHLVASLRDISARRRAQDAVARELAFQQRLIDTLPNPLFLKDVQGRYTRVNRAFEQAYGMRREDLVGRTVLELTSLDAATREAMHRQDMQTITQGDLFHGQFTNHWADGQLHQTLFWGQGMTDVDGQPDGMVGVVLDITEQAEARAALAEREHQLRDLLESAPGTVIVTDASGQVLFHNQHALQMFGMDAQALTTQGMVMRYVDVAQRRALLERLAREGHVRAADAQMLRGDGTPFWAQLSLSRGTFGQVRGATFGWAVDVTERRRTTEMLQMAKDAAEAATAAKSGFLANMSHEIRTPMNAIIGLAHLALQTRLTERQRDYVQKVHEAARALLGIVNDILDFSKIEAGKLVIEQADFDLDALMAQLATLTGEKAGDKQLELLFDIGEAVPRQLRGDALRLGQVLTNLVTNAVKFTARGEIVLRCRHRVLAGGALVLDFSVRDTGIGMKPEQVARLFVPFSQADESTTRRFGGTGLGLSICKRLIDAAGGHIDVQSTLEQGAQFSFTWPCAPGGGPPPALPVAGQGLRALVVDDHAAAGAILAGALARRGMQVERAADAQAALAVLRGAPLGLVFTDLHMPGLDGLALTRQIRAGGAAAPKVVLVAAQGDDALRRAAAAAGASAVLLKPVTGAALAAVLAPLLGEDAGPLPAAAHAPEAVPRLDGLRVLLAEDNAINQQIAVELLRAAGVAVEVVGDGRACVQRLLAAGPRAFDVVLMDLQMPVMDGHGANALIRAQGRFDALPIVAMTAHAMVEERQRCLDEGMNDHIAKPIDPAQLYRTLAQWAPRTPQPATLPAAALPPAPAAAPSAWQQQLVQHVPGLDAAGALRRVLGRQPLYAQLLQHYLDTQGQAAEAIDAALAQGDWAQAELLAHTLKGVSANIGADRVAAEAGQLEQALRARAGTDTAALAAALAPVLQGLRRFLGGAAQAAPALAAAGPSDAQARAGLQRLCEMLENMESEAREQLERMEPWLREQLTAAEMQALWRHVRQYDLDEALALLHGAPGLARWQTGAQGVATAGAPGSP